MTDRGIASNARPDVGNDLREQDAERDGVTRADMFCALYLAIGDYTARGFHLRARGLTAARDFILIHSAPAKAVDSGERQSSHERFGIDCNSLDAEADAGSTGRGECGGANVSDRRDSRERPASDCDSTGRPVAALSVPDATTPVDGAGAVHIVPAAPASHSDDRAPVFPLPGKREDCGHEG